MIRTLSVIPLALAACAPDAPAPTAPATAFTASTSATLRATTSDYPDGGCHHPVHNATGMPLQDIVDDVGPYGTLVVDQTCAIDGGLVLPDRFTLRGEGWTGSGILEFVTADPITFDGGGDDDASSTLENLHLEGAGAGTAVQIFGRHNVHLRDLIVRNFEIGVHGRAAFSVDLDHSNLSLNEIGVQLGYNANTWRITGGICSQNTTCMDLHQTGQGNDVMVLGVRMESNDTAVRVAGQSTYLAFNRFEGNGIDIEELESAVGTAILANNTATGTTSDLSQLNEGGLTGLPRIDRELQLSIVPDGLPTTQIASHYVPVDNLLRTQLLANQYTEDGVAVEPGYGVGYAGWLLELDGSTSDLTSSLRVSYRGPGDAGDPVEVFRIQPDGTVEATAFLATSDVRRKTDLEPVQGALARLQALRGMGYAWADGPAAGRASMGLLAQDVQQVFPSAVAATEAGGLKVHHDQLLAPMVEAIKELAAENRALRDRLDALEATAAVR